VLTYFSSLYSFLFFCWVTGYGMVAPLKSFPPALISNSPISGPLAGRFSNPPLFSFLDCRLPIVHLLFSSSLPFLMPPLLTHAQVSFRDEKRSNSLLKRDKSYPPLPLHSIIQSPPFSAEPFSGLVLQVSCLPFSGRSCFPITFLGGPNFLCQRQAAPRLPPLRPIPLKKFQRRSNVYSPV